mgnify:CR=1 FL=1
MKKRFEPIAKLLPGLITRGAVFLLLVFLAFSLPRLLPGDQMALLQSSDLGRALTQGELEHLQQTSGLSGSWAAQFLRYLKGLAAGDLGYSLPHAAPVSQLLLATLPWSLLLLCLALPVSLGLGVYGGIAAGQARGTLRDRCLTGAMTLLAGIPPFTTALLLLLLLGILWPLFPASGAEPVFPAATALQRGFDILRHAFLPALALAAHEISRFFFLVRAETVSLSQRAFVLNARARGILGWRLQAGYYGRNLLAVVLARLSETLTGLFGAVLFVEIVFSYPGTGLLIYTAILERDYALIQGLVIALAALVLSLNWAVDTLADLLAQRG